MTSRSLAWTIGWMLVLYHGKNKETETGLKENYKFNLEPTEFKDTQVGLASGLSNLVVRNLGERYQLETQT